MDGVSEIPVCWDPEWRSSNRDRSEKLAKERIQVVLMQMGAQLQEATYGSLRPGKSA